MKKRLLYTILSISLLTVMAGAAIAPKGHFIGRTMMAVEALWSYRNKTELK